MKHLKIFERFIYESKEDKKREETITSIKEIVDSIEPLVIDILLRLDDYTIDIQDNGIKVDLYFGNGVEHHFNEVCKLTEGQIEYRMDNYDNEELDDIKESLGSGDNQCYLIQMKNEDEESHMDVIKSIIERLKTTYDINIKGEKDIDGINFALFTLKIKEEDEEDN